LTLQKKGILNGLISNNFNVPHVFNTTKKKALKHIKIKEESSTLLLGFFYFWLMENDNEYELIVSQGKLPLWRIIIASLFFSYMIYMLYILCILFYRVELAKVKPKGIAGIIEIAAFCFAGGVSFSIKKSILIDLDKEKLVSIYMVGPFSRKVIKVLPELEYLSVFKIDESKYEVNLWYLGNKHYKMYTFTEKELAIKFGAMAALKLNIDLLYATEKGNHKWIEKQTI
jgi:hypothetical protein